MIECSCLFLYLFVSKCAWLLSLLLVVFLFLVCFCPRLLLHWCIDSFLPSFCRLFVCLLVCFCLFQCLFVWLVSFQCTIIQSDLQQQSLLITTATIFHPNPVLPPCTFHSIWTLPAVATNLQQPVYSTSDWPLWRVCLVELLSLDPLPTKSRSSRDTRSPWKEE